MGAVRAELAKSSALAISDLETQLPTVLQVLPHGKVGELLSCSDRLPPGEDRGDARCWMDGAIG